MQSISLEDSFQELFELDESELTVELGRRLELTRREQIKGAPISAANQLGRLEDEEQLQGWEDGLDVGRSFLRRFNRELYSLVCDPNDPDNARVMGIVEKGAESIGLFLAGFLVANFALIPAIATVVAALVAKRFAKAGHGATCEVWAKQL